MSQIAFLFPGQGAQSVGMGRQIYESHPAARELFQRAAEVLGYDLAGVCLEGPADQLDSTVYSQPALFVTSLAGLEWLRSEQPDVLDAVGAAAGLSLGEYTAMTFAGVLDFETGLRIVQQRGEAMQEAADATPSGMVSVLGLAPDAVQQLCDDCRLPGEVLQVANLLCPGNIAISGHRESCERAAAEAAARGAIKAVPLAVAGAFHTPLMQSAVARLTAALESATLQPPRLPVISNVDGQSHDAVDEIRQLLIRQVVSPVLWEESMRELLGRGFRQFYEVGPGRVLRGLLRRIDRKAAVESLPG